MKQYFPLKFSFLLIILYVTGSWAAACCMSGGVGISWITGDEKALLQTSWSSGVVVIDALADGSYVLRDSSEWDYEHTLSIGGSFLLSDRFQLSGRLPIVLKNYPYDESRVNQLGFGDASLGIGFQAFKNLRYSAWKPDILLTSALVIPLGTSVYEATLPQEAFSSGFFHLSFGSILTKVWSQWDSSLRLDIDIPIAKSFDDPNTFESHFFQPTPGFLVAMTLGYRFNNSKWRLGMGVSPKFQGHIYVEGASSSEIEWKSLWNTSVDVSYQITDHTLLNVSYTDQTLLGPAHSNELQRSVALLLQRTWDR